jgi:hypothetical protein
MNICLKKTLAAFLLLLPALAFSAPVAYIHEMQGSVSTSTLNSLPKALKTGDTLDEGQTVTAGKDSSATLRFADGQLVVLHPETTFSISKYKYNEKDVKSSSVFFRLAIGAMRFVSGVIGATNPRSFGIQTPTATIGIRGTDGVVIADSDFTSVSSSSGTVVFTTSDGNADVQPGHYSSARRNHAPGAPVLESQAPSTDRAKVLRLMHTSVPQNTPVDVNSSASAARARAAALEAARRAAANPTPENQQAARAAEEAAAASAAAAAAAAAAAGDAASNGGGVPPAPPASSDTFPPPTGADTTPSPSTTSGGGGGSGTASTQ